MDVNGVDVLADVLLRLFGEALGTQALREFAVVIMTAQYRWVVFAPALSAGAAGAGEFFRAAWAGFIHGVSGFAVIMCVNYNVSVCGVCGDFR